VPRSIGRLRRVRVAQVDPAAGDAGTGWYLAHVVVSPPGATPSDPASTITFPCNGWLGANEDCGGDARPAGVMARELAPPGAGPAASAAVAPSRPRPAAAAAALTFEGGAAALPHPEKVAKDGAKAVVRAASGHAGEDAYFLQARLPAGGLGLGVSDGVWMWRLHGIDAGAFSRALMRHAASALAAGEADPAAALATAEACVLAAGIQGSATACVVVLDAAGALMAANVGDSGFAVVGAPPYGGAVGRHAQSPGPGSAPSTARRVVKFRSPQQEHEFGRPYQLGHAPTADRAADAMRASLPLAPGDLVILGSDGLWDNLDDDAMLDAVAAGDAAREPAAALARRLAAAAFDGSVDRKRATPYSIAATEELGMIYSGGKADDIAVVVARCRAAS
jgi:protein phosphatase PTC7